VFTRPHLLLAGDAGAEFLEFRSCQHPSLMSRCGTAPVIPNDIVLGTGENAPTFTIVTGPNMGTLLLRDQSERFRREIDLAETDLFDCDPCSVGMLCSCC
jgi:hypothetical protein